jgi:hypothetical protein
MSAGILRSYSHRWITHKNDSPVECLNDRIEMQENRKGPASAPPFGRFAAFTPVSRAPEAGVERCAFFSRFRAADFRVGSILFGLDSGLSYALFFLGLFFSRWKLKLFPLRWGRSPPLNGLSLMNFRFGSIVFGRAFGTSTMGQPS